MKPYLEKILVAILPIFCLTLESTGELESVLTLCCMLGGQWAQGNPTCGSFPAPVPGVKAEHQATCLSALEICCIRYHRSRKCEEGKETARRGQECSILLAIGGEAHKDCCEGCKLGLITSSIGLPCSFQDFAFGTPWDEAFYDCCIRTSKDTISPDGSDLSDSGKTRCEPNNPCTQKCTDTGAEIKCSCYPGYKLAADLRSCEDVDECILGTDTCRKDVEKCENTFGGFKCIPKSPNSRDGQCPRGYAYNAATRTCDDVDECLLNSHTCDQNTETCANTVGSFSCVPKITNACPPGFKMGDSPGTCVDVDECAENLHGCNLEEEYCLNVYSGYNCQPREDHQCPAGYKWIQESEACEDVDECQEKLDNCDSEKEQCRNVVGAYECDIRCKSGYSYNPSLQICVDIDECEAGAHTCNLETETCVNKQATFDCIPKPVPCSKGYRKNRRTNECEDINECEEGQHDCDHSTQYCVNIPGGFRCQAIPITPPVPKCGTGYIENSLTGVCEDINECEEGNPCSENYVCENSEGSFRCICPEGFIRDPVTKECTDINECQVGQHNCGPGQRCDNSIGSFTCFRLASCGTGYTLNAESGQCEDDDECQLGNHNCGPGYVCRNTLGSFRCDRITCPRGQRLLADGICHPVLCPRGMEVDQAGECIDIDECARSTPCRSNQRCINTVGSFRCQHAISCGIGYELNDEGNMCLVKRVCDWKVGDHKQLKIQPVARCLRSANVRLCEAENCEHQVRNIDECARGINECKVDQVCRNRPGSYSCECPTGYVMNSKRECEDIDECIRYRGQVCSVNSECKNVPGSYSCNCKAGFQSTDDSNCIDIDECAETPNLCQQNCVNIWGSYQCTCNQGYTLAPDKRSCQDLDECALWKGKGNLCIGICVNEPGSYSCTCPDGYRLGPDKRTCLDINECEEQNVCKGENEVCLNTRGSYKCNVIECPHNYIRDRDHRNRCKRVSMECRRGDADCLKQPISYSYNFITFVSRIPIPPTGQLDLFTMRGPRFTFTSVQFDLQMKQVHAPAGVQPATREHFHLRRTAFNEAMVSVVKPLVGPQDIELELAMKMYHNGLFGGTALAKLFIFVSQYEY